MSNLLRQIPLLLIALLSFNAHAAVTLVSGQTFTQAADHWGASTSSAAKDLPVAATAGNLIVVGIVYAEGAGTEDVISIDDAGSTVYALVRQQQDPSTLGVTLEIWAGIAAGVNAGQDVVVTVQTIASSSNHFIGLLEFAGVDADQTGLPGNGANTGSATSHDSGSVTPGVADNVIVAITSGSNRDWGNDADFTNVYDSSRSLFSYKIQSANTAQSFTATSDTAGFCVLDIAAFRGAAGGASGLLLRRRRN